MRRAAAMTASVVLLLAGCQGDGDEPSATPTDTVPTSADAATTETETEDDGTTAPGTTEATGTEDAPEDTSDDATDPEETSEEATDDATDEPDTSGDGPTRTGSPQALPSWTNDPQEQAPTQVGADGEPQEITDVRTGLHEDFDRVVLDLTGDEPVLGWFAGLTDEAVQGGSGLPMDVEGETFLQLEVRGIDWTTQSPDRYDGSTVAGAGTVVLTEVVFGVLFEGQQQVVLGLREETDYRIFSLSDPARIVVDVRHP